MLKRVSHCFYMIFIYLSSWLYSSSILTAQSYEGIPLNIGGEKSPGFRNHLSFGGALAEGDGTLGRDGGEPMLSLLYSRSFHPILEGELAVNYLIVHRQTAIYSGFSYFTLSWLFDGSLMVQPLANSAFLPGLRVGAGLTFRRLSAVWMNTTGGGLSANGQDTIFYRSFPIASYTNNNTLGVNIKLEYLFPLSTRCDIGLRAQVILFDFPFQGISLDGSTFYIGRRGLGSLGMYVRINW